MMASFKAIPICNPCSTANHKQQCHYNCNQKLSFSDFGSRSAILNLLPQKKWEYASRALVQSEGVKTSVEDDKPYVSSGDTKEIQITQARRFHKDLNLLPSEF